MNQTFILSLFLFFFLLGGSYFYRIKQRKWWRKRYFLLFSYSFNIDDFVWALPKTSSVFGGKTYNLSGIAFFLLIYEKVTMNQVGCLQLQVTKPTKISLNNKEIPCQEKTPQRYGGSGCHAIRHQLGTRVLQHSWPSYAHPTLSRGWQRTSLLGCPVSKETFPRRHSSGQQTSFWISLASPYQPPPQTQPLGKKVGSSRLAYLGLRNLTNHLPKPSTS